MFAADSNNSADTRVECAVKALIVDDSAVMRKVVERALRQAGMDLSETLEAGNGADALFATAREY